ncbi:MAG: Hsp20/alpha crystallin family protein [Candidatus Acidiferrales bacterium]
MAAEREVLPELAAHVSQSDGIVYALASMPGVTAAEVSVRVESEWLVILAHSSGSGRSAAQSFHVIELPAALDPARSVAVLSGGLLAIHMPKAETPSELPSSARRPLVV